MRLAEIGQKQWMMGGARRLGIRERLLDKDYALGEAARQRIRVPEMRRCDVRKAPHLGRPAELDGTLERRDSLGDGAPAEGDEAQAPVGEDEAGGLIHLTGDPECLLTVRHRIRELAKLGEAPGQVRARAD